MTIYIEFTEDGGELIVDGKPILTLRRDNDPGIAIIEVAKAMTKLIPGAVFVEE